MDVSVDDLKDKIADLQEYFNNLGKNQQIAYLAILVGILLVVASFFVF